MAGQPGEKKVNIFKKDLDFSNAASEEKFWQEIYQQAFPNMIFAQLCINETKTQNQDLGIDRCIMLESGKCLYIDEKKRRPDQKFHDILLEFGNRYVDTNTFKYDGWMNKELLIDYLAYAWLAWYKVCLLDWQILNRVWQINCFEWIEKAKESFILKNKGLKPKNEFMLVEAFNPDKENPIWITYSVALPTKTLLDKMNETRVIQL